MTLYELIAGQLPLNGATTYELTIAHMNTVPVPLRELRGDIPVSLSDAVARALEKDPARRFGSAAEFKAALRTPEAPMSLAAVTSAPAGTWQRIGTDDLLRPQTASVALPVEAVIKHLASFIGPIAKIVVNRWGKQHTDLGQVVCGGGQADRWRGGPAAVLADAATVREPTLTTMKLSLGWGTRVLVDLQRLAIQQVHRLFQAGVLRLNERVTCATSSLPETGSWSRPISPWLIRSAEAEMV